MPGRTVRRRRERAAFPWLSATLALVLISALAFPALRSRAGEPGTCVGDEWTLRTRMVESPAASDAVTPPVQATPSSSAPESWIPTTPTLVGPAEGEVAEPSASLSSQ